jgi:hypothetical protein
MLRIGRRLAGLEIVAEQDARDDQKERHRDIRDG